MSRGFGNCAGLSAMRSPEDLRIFTVFSRKKKICCEVSKTYPPCTWPPTFMPL